LPWSKFLGNTSKPIGKSLNFRAIVTLMHKAYSPLFFGRSLLIIILKDAVFIRAKCLIVGKQWINILPKELKEPGFKLYLTKA
jgi:hypothetical protein